MKIVVALGGNALASGKASHLEVIKNLRKVTPFLCSLIKEGHQIVIVHGSGPQAGALLLQAELAKKKVPAMPLDVLDAEVQGQLGYLIEQVLLNELNKLKLKKHVVTVITRILVDKKDLAFRNPSKPVGPFYTAAQARALMKNGVVYKEDAGRGWRRVVASPLPKKIIELETINQLVKEGIVTIAAGGGGIPVVKNRNTFVGVEAVVDKDLAASLLAHHIAADLLLIITSIDRVYLNFRKRNQCGLKRIHLKEAKKYLSQGHFAEGSMAPKISAAISFLEKGGKKVIITDEGHASAAMLGKIGTTIVK